MITTPALILCLSCNLSTSITKYTWGKKQNSMFAHGKSYLSAQVKSKKGNSLGICKSVLNERWPCIYAATVTVYVVDTFGVSSLIISLSEEHASMNSSSVTAPSESLQETNSNKGEVGLLDLLSVISASKRLYEWVSHWVVPTVLSCWCCCCDLLMVFSLKSLWPINVIVIDIVVVVTYWCCCYWYCCCCDLLMLLLLILLLLLLILLLLLLILLLLLFCWCDLSIFVKISSALPSPSEPSILYTPSTTLKI